MYYVYFLKSINYPDQIYIGYTNNLKERFQKHNNGGCTHTSKYKPWQIHAYFAFNKKEQASAFEKYLKSGSGFSFAQRHFW